MSLFSRLSADCDFKSRVLRTLMDANVRVRNKYRGWKLMHREPFSSLT